MTPLLEIAVEPKWKADIQKLALVLSRLAAGDASLRIRIDPELGQAVIGGVSEQHLDGIVGQIRRDLAVNVGNPQVAYLETISKAGEIDYTHKKQSRGSGQYARVKLRCEPLPFGSGCQFANEVKDGSVPQQYVPGVAKGLKAAMENGVIAGFPVTDIKATLYDGAYHDVDSSALAFEIATRAAVREGLPKAEPKLLEPIMTVEISTPSEYLDEISRDLKTRRGEVSGTKSEGDRCLVSTVVPLANLFGYDKALSALTRDHATFTMKYSYYAAVPLSYDDDPFRPAGAVAMRVA